MAGCDGLLCVGHMMLVFFWCICKFQKFNLLLFCVFVCMCMLVNVHTYVMYACVSVHVEVKGQVCRVGFLLHLLSGLHELNSSHHACGVGAFTD